MAKTGGEIMKGSNTKKQVKTKKIVKEVSSPKSVKKSQRGVAEISETKEELVRKN